ncbi:MAG: hypothetical protein ACREE7_13495, partial [Dongiaceae bacterium]
MLHDLGLSGGEARQRVAAEPDLAGGKAQGPRKAADEVNLRGGKRINGEIAEAGVKLGRRMAPQIPGAVSRIGRLRGNSEQRHARTVHRIALAPRRIADQQRYA